MWMKMGQRVTFTVDAFPNDEFAGVVTQVRQSATTTSNVVTYEVVISAPNPDLKLMPGLTANVVIYTLELHDVLAVSAKALRYVPKEMLLGKDYQIVDCEGKSKVWVMEGKTLRAIPVKVGTSNGVMTEIVGGLNEGTVIINETAVKASANMPNEAPQGGSNPFMPGPPGSKKK